MLFLNFRGISGLLGIPGIIPAMIRSVYWSIEPMLIGAAVLLLLPLARTIPLAKKDDIESQLLQLKSEYENGCMSERSFYKVQKELLEKL